MSSEPSGPLGRGCAPLTPEGSPVITLYPCKVTDLTQEQTREVAAGEAASAETRPRSTLIPGYGTEGRPSRPRQSRDKHRRPGRRAGVGGWRRPQRSPSRGAWGWAAARTGPSREGLRGPRGATRPRGAGRPGPSPTARRGAAWPGPGRAGPRGLPGALRSDAPRRGEAVGLGTHPSRPWCRRARCRYHHRRRPPQRLTTFPTRPRARPPPARVPAAPRPPGAAPYRRQREPPGRPRAGGLGWPRSPAPVRRPRAGSGEESAPGNAGRGQRRPELPPAGPAPSPGQSLPCRKEPSRPRHRAASPRPSQAAGGRRPESLSSSLGEQDPPQVLLHSGRARLGCCCPGGALHTATPCPKSLQTNPRF